MLTPHPQPPFSIHIRLHFKPFFVTPHPHFLRVDVINGWPQMLIYLISQRKLYIFSNRKKTKKMSCTSFIGFCENRKLFLKDGELPLFFKSGVTFNFSQ